jgi:hypothetical protein
MRSAVCTKVIQRKTAQVGASLGGANSSRKPAPIGSAEAAIQGWRRPKRVRVLSESVPRIGSEKASIACATKAERP